MAPSEIITNLLTAVEGLASQLSDGVVTAESLDELANQLLQQIVKLPAHTTSNEALLAEEDQVRMQICAVSLWNATVAKKAVGFLSTKHNAILRHVACTLVFFSQPPANADEDTCNKQITMAFKTAQAWIDCDNPTMAESALSQASECLDKLNSSQSVGCADSPISSGEQDRKHSIQVDQFKLFTFQAQAAHSQGQDEKARESIGRAKDLLPCLPDERSYLAKLCYNFGLDCFQNKLICESIGYLKESYELGQGMEDVGPVTQSRTLRLLATAYLESSDGEHFKDAMKAVDLAHKVHPHVAGSYLRLRILIQSPADAELVKTGLEGVLAHEDLTVDIALSAIELVMKSRWTSLALEPMKLLSGRYQSSPDVGKIWAAQVEMLLSAGKHHEARSFLETCAQKCKSGQTICDTVKRRLHYHAWERASLAYESKYYEEALAWYSISMELFSCQGQPNKADLAKLHRNLASCHLGLKQNKEASSSADKAEQSDPDNVHTQYIVFKVALANHDEDKAKRALEMMAKASAETGQGGDDAMEIDSNENSSADGFICLAAQMAFEVEQRPLALHALEQLIEHTSNDTQCLTALRCVTRLQLTFMDEGGNKEDYLEIILKYVETAHNRLDRMKQQKCSTITIQQESSWFMKIAWNMGLQCDGAHMMMYKMFMQCYKLCALCLDGVTCWIRQRTCLLIAVAALLEVSRKTGGTVKVQALRESLECITECNNILGKIEQERMSGQGSGGRDGTTTMLLLLYEFEARTHLADGQLEMVLEKAIGIPQAEPKTFETMAALAMECKMPNQSVAIRSLKVAIKKHMQQQSTDYEKCSKAFHSLIELALRGGSTGDDITKEEVWGYYMDVIAIIENNSQGQYPEMEILWLMTKAWNCGVQFYSCHKYRDAGQWCELAMRFLSHLTSMKANYESRMQQVYSEIQAKSGPSSDQPINPQQTQLISAQH